MNGGRSELSTFFWPVRVGVGGTAGGSVTVIVLMVEYALQLPGWRRGLVGAFEAEHGSAPCDVTDQKRYCAEKPSRSA